MILLKDIQVDGLKKDVLIEGERIGRISSDPVVPSPGTEIVDCRGKALIPGFVNMHSHAAMILLRGIHEDLRLYDWLERVWKIEAVIDRNFVYQASRLACLEMIKGGTTCFNDHYWFAPETRRAALELGIRPVISFLFLDGHDRETAQKQRLACERLYERSKEWNDSHGFAIGIHSVYTVSEENILWANDFALEHGLRVHMHLAETALEVSDCRREHGGLSPVGYFDRLGVLGSHTIAAHCLYLSDDDVEILGKRKVNCVHNINSNAKLASGFRFRYNELRDAGANLCLGTDGAASSNNLDMLETMKTTALFQKAWREDPTQMPLGELMDCATVNGAKALGLECGEIREGALADLSVVDLDNSYFLSPGTFLGNLVYSAHSDVISDVIAGGRFVMRGRKVEGEEEILEGARSVLGMIHSEK